MAWHGSYCASYSPLVPLQHRGAPFLGALFFMLLPQHGDGEKCREEHSAGGALRRETKVLGTDSERLGSEASLKAATMSKAFRQMSLSF